MRCRNCNKSYLKKIVEVGRQPMSGIFPKKQNIKLKQYSLDLFICKKCQLVQLGNNAPAKDMFGEKYGYQSSISKLMKNHLYKIYKSLKKKKFVENNSFVLDIGSNDGTFLNFFKKSNKLYGVDPTSNKFKKFYKSNIKRINSFFSFKKICQVFAKNSNKKFDLISSFAMFYDVNTPNSFCRDICKLLKPDGIWILELSYFPLLLKNLTYDQICHEHVTYYSLKVFKNIAEKNHLKIIEVSLNEINGGSIQIICAKKNSKRKILSQSLITSILRDEEKIKVKSFENFNKRILLLKRKLLNFFEKNQNKKIFGYGASTKGNIVLNYCGVNDKSLKYICDANKLKYGSYTPGSNIKIISKEKMRKMKPDFLFVLIWSFRKEVIREEIKFLKKGGKLIFMLPRFHIIDKKNYKKFWKKKFEHQSYNY